MQSRKAAKIHSLRLCGFLIFTISWFIPGLYLVQKMMVKQFFLYRTYIIQD